MSTNPAQPEIAAQRSVATPGDGILVRVCSRCYQPLTDRQKRFCSPKCRTAHWDALHPRVNVPGIGEYRQAGSITDRLHGLMQKQRASGDGWLTTDQMAQALHERGETVAASLRRLRSRLAALGQPHAIQKRRTDGPGSGTQAPREYRLAA